MTTSHSTNARYWRNSISSIRVRYTCKYPSPRTLWDWQDPSDYPSPFPWNSSDCYPWAARRRASRTSNPSWNRACANFDPIWDPYCTSTGCFGCFRSGRFSIESFSDRRERSDRFGWTLVCCTSRNSITSPKTWRALQFRTVNIWLS